MSSELAIPAQPQAFTPDDLATLKQTICKGATDPELKLFCAVCQRTGLDPFTRQIYWIPGKGPMTSVDGFRVVSERSGQYQGMVAPQWCGPDGQWRDVWLEQAPPAACRVGVYRKGFREAVFAVATWKGYAQTSGQWSKNGPNMLAKCAESLARRMAFPQELSGLYTSEEMNADNEEPHGSIFDDPPIKIIEPNPETNSSGPGYKPPAQRTPPDRGSEIPDAEFTHVSDALPKPPPTAAQIAKEATSGDTGEWEVIDGETFDFDDGGPKLGILYTLQDENGAQFKGKYWSFANAMERTGMAHPQQYRGMIAAKRQVRKPGSPYDLTSLRIISANTPGN